MGHEEKQSGLKKCPLCAENIKQQAKVCHFCGASLTPVVENQQPASEKPHPAQAPIQPAALSQQGKNRFLRPAVLIPLFVLLALAGAVFYLSRNDKDLQMAAEHNTTANSLADEVEADNDQLEQLANEMNIILQNFTSVQTNVTKSLGERQPVPQSLIDEGRNLQVQLEGKIVATDTLLADASIKISSYEQERIACTEDVRASVEGSDSEWYLQWAAKTEEINSVEVAWMKSRQNLIAANMQGEKILYQDMVKMNEVTAVAAGGLDYTSARNMLDLMRSYYESRNPQMEKQNTDVAVYKEESDRLLKDLERLKDERDAFESSNWYRIPLERKWSIIVWD